MAGRSNMNAEELRSLWSKTLCQQYPSVDAFDRLANKIVDLYDNGDTRFRQHIKNRFNRVTEATGQAFDPEHFNVEMARAFIVDEIGFGSWNELKEFVQRQNDHEYPILFKYAVAALWRGDFTALELAMGGPEAFDPQIRAWLEDGYLVKEPETMAESFAAACMLGHPEAAAALLEAGVDPYAGMRTGLSGFHYAASSGRLDVIKLLIGRKVPMEVRNMYGGTVFGQAMWSAVNEHTPDHAAIVEALIEAGAVVDTGYLQWWEEQKVPSDETKQRIAAALRCRPGE